MEILMFALLMLAAVLLSSVIDQLVPKISSPLIQIGLGLLIALAAGGQIDIIFEEPNLFLVLFIAPLLYDEAKSVDKTALWKNKRSVISLAIGLVFLTTLIVGYSVNWIEPSISLAAAFALGAALGPTDAVAVASLSKETTLSARAKSVLEGESLINDASGVVAFQFALAAAVTGTFSLLDATGEFLFTFFGGIIVGIILGYLGNFLSNQARSMNLVNTTFHVLFEIFTPFIVYLCADQLGTSGILAVVAAGLTSAISQRTLGPSVSRLNIVSSSVWRVISFALNGIVFVLLGTQLPRAMQTTWENTVFDSGTLIVFVLGLTAILICVRFAWVLIMEYIHHRRTKSTSKSSLHSNLIPSAIMTLAGPKGTITLAVMLTMPASVAQQQLMLFLACGVILTTLLIATFVVPLLAPQNKTSEQDLACNETEEKLEILRTVIEELAARQTNETRAATQTVIASYNDRIARIKTHNNIEDTSSVQLHIQTLEWEQEFVHRKMKSGFLNPLIAFEYINHLERLEHILINHQGRWSIPKAALHIQTFMRLSWQKLIQKLPAARLTETTQAVRELQIESCEMVVKKLREELHSEKSPENAEDISALILDYVKTIRTLRNTNLSITARADASDKAIEIERLGLRLELEEIQTRYDDGKLCRASAKRMRENVYLMQVDLEDNV